MVRDHFQWRVSVLATLNLRELLAENYLVNGSGLHRTNQMRGKNYDAREGMAECLKREVAILYQDD